MNQNLKVEFSYSYYGDLVFEGTWKVENFKVLFLTTDVDYGSTPLSYLSELAAKENPGVCVVENDEYDDLMDALGDVSVRTTYSIECDS